jgi:hypothetical protein
MDKSPSSAKWDAEIRRPTGPGLITDLVAAYRRPDSADIVEVVSIDDQIDKFVVVLEVLKH